MLRVSHCRRLRGFTYLNIVLLRAGLVIVGVNFRVLQEELAVLLVNLGQKMDSQGRKVVICDNGTGVNISN
jgi:hypothetical protein